MKCVIINILMRLFKKEKKQREPIKCQDCNWCLLNNAGNCENCDSKLCN